MLRISTWGTRGTKRSGNLFRATSTPIKGRGWSLTACRLAVEFLWEVRNAALSCLKNSVSNFRWLGRFSQSDKGENANCQKNRWDPGRVSTVLVICGLNDTDAGPSGELLHTKLSLTRVNSSACITQFFYNRLLDLRVRVLMVHVFPNLSTYNRLTCSINKKLHYH